MRINAGIYLSKIQELKNKMLRNIERIDCVGNANNYVLIIVRALRKMGIDARLHLTMGCSLDNPENFFPEYKDGYPSWITDWRENKRHIFLSEHPELERELCAELIKSDGLILNYDAIAMGSLLAMPSVCVLTGTDLYDFSDVNAILRDFDLQSDSPSNFLAGRRRHSVIVRTLRQRAAIRNACAFTFFPKGHLPAADAILRDIGAHDENRISFLLTDVDAHAYVPPSEREEMLLLYTARLTWGGHGAGFTEIDNKGTDIFLRGFAKFLESGGKGRLRLFRKGKSIAQTHALIDELGIASFVEWRDEMSQHEFNEALADADVVVDQTGTSTPGMAVAAAMSIGRPVIASLNGSAASGFLADAPICAAERVEEICSWLSRLSLDLDLRRDIGEKARTYAVEHFSGANAATMILDALRRNPQNFGETLLWRQLALDDLRGDYFRLVSSAR